MSPTVYVVSGAGRGIGFSIVQNLSTRPDTVVFAGVRSFPSLSPQLSQLAAELPEVVIPIKITSADEADNAASAEHVKARFGKVDVVIANAGGSVIAGPATALEITPSTLHADIEVNTVGPLVLYQAFASLLLAANEKVPGSSKFIVISSLTGRITGTFPRSVVSYGATKAAVNYIVSKIDKETPGVIAFPISPGIVITDSAIAATKNMGIEDMTTIGAITSGESAKGVLDVIDKATKATHGGRFWDEKGEELTY